LLAFESVAPFINADSVSEISSAEIRARAFKTVKRFGTEIEHVSAIFIPEIIADGKKYAETRAYGKEIRECAANARGQVSPDIALFRVSVAQDASVQKLWLEESARLGFLNVIPVGGESIKIQYPGPTPGEFMRLRYALDTDHPFRFGSVCIPQRGRVPRNGNTTIDQGLESRKMTGKQMAGAEYFVTQIQYDAEHLGPMIDLYLQRCQELHIPPGTY